MRLRKVSFIPGDSGHGRPLGILTVQHPHKAHPLPGPRPHTVPAAVAPWSEDFLHPCLRCLEPQSRGPRPRTSGEEDRKMLFLCQPALRVGNGLVHCGDQLWSLSCWRTSFLPQDTCVKSSFCRVLGVSHSFKPHKRVLRNSLSHSACRCYLHLTKEEADSGKGREDRALAVSWQGKPRRKAPSPGPSAELLG